MDTNLDDPHNHAPEVTPDDVWGDAEGLHQNFNAAATVLPPKRAKAENQASGPQGRNMEGLRIDSNPQRRETDDTEPQTLEVQQIDGSVVRLDPEAPTVARIPRHIAFHERPARVEEEPQQRGEGKEWGHSRKQSVRWILGTGMGVGSLVVVAMMLLPLVNKSNADRQGQNGPAWVPETDPEGTEELNDMLARQPEAEQVFRNYASAMIVDDLVSLVRDPDSVLPLIRRNFQPGIVTKSWLPAEDTQWSVFDSGKTRYGILEGSLPDFSKFSAYLVFSENGLKLDWKATTCYGTATFSELMKNQGDPSEIRATITSSGFYTAVFPESDYQSYQFIAPNNEDAIWCYARRGSRTNGEISRLFDGGAILNSGPEAQKVTLRLERAPEGALPNQWLIAEMLHKDWLIP